MMKDTSLEELSALIDGDLPQEAVDRLIDLLTKDASMRAAWMRYHLMSDALRNHLPQSICLNLAKGVSLALAREPIFTAPKQRSFSRVIPIAGLAIAASVAGITLLGVQRIYKEDQTPPEPLPVAEQPVLHSLPVSTMRWNGQPSSPSRLNSYLLNHNRYNPSLSMQGVSPYVRIVSYETSP
jgi:sigma-E factor negative regulatory protein RseA